MFHYSLCITETFYCNCVTSGYISVEELRFVMENLGDKMPAEEIDEMLLEADKNRDGAIDYDEFVHMICKGNY